MTGDDFWDNLMLGQHSHTASALDSFLQNHSPAQNVGLRALTDKARETNALELPVEAGTRVSFVTNIGSVLSYVDPPAPESEGTVVMVRTAEGNQTGFGGMVFVKFDAGQFMAMHPEHLRRATLNQKRASGFVRRVSSLGDLGDFLKTGSEHELVHKATKDLWSFEETSNGDYVLARLFDDSGSPLKI